MNVQNSGQIDTICDNDTGNLGHMKVIISANCRFLLNTSSIINVITCIKFFKFTSGLVLNSSTKQSLYQQFSETFHFYILERSSHKNKIFICTICRCYLQQFLELSLVTDWRVCSKFLLHKRQETNRHIFPPKKETKI